MQIKQLSALLDNKLAELDARVIKQKKNLSQSQNAEATTKIQQELDELARVRSKLIKSKELAWEAHSLERDSNKKLNQRKATIGLVLCVAGGLATLVLIFMFIRNFMN